MSRLSDPALGNQSQWIVIARGFWRAQRRTGTHSRMISRTFSSIYYSIVHLHKHKIFELPLNWQPDDTSAACINTLPHGRSSNTQW